MVIAEADMESNAMTILPMCKYYAMHKQICDKRNAMNAKADDCLLVYMTAPDKDSAASWCETLVAERLAACANILDGASSLYWWQGKIEKAAETVCILKTTRSRFAAFTARAKELHSYETPCIVALPLADGLPDFLHWIRAETTTEATEGALSPLAPPAGE